MKALLSLYDKTGSEDFAGALVAHGFEIISSGGTAKYLSEKNIPVTDVSEITGLSPVLGHRVVTLAPQIHGGLLAKGDMLAELQSLGWPKIDLLYVTFYPLEEELKRPGATFESCLEKTDIGGPTMIRSANKGGEVVVMTSPDQVERVLRWFREGEPEKEKFLFGLRAAAEERVAEYVSLSAEVYRKFGRDYGYKAEHGYPRYLMKVDGRLEFLPLARAARAYDYGMAPVEFGDIVMEREGVVREMSAQDRMLISQVADEYSASK